jgi:predicted Zn-dependent protease
MKRMLFVGVLWVSLILLASSSSAVSALKDDKSDIERVDFIHYKKAGGNGGKPPKADVCYKLMGVKWSMLPVSYAINPTNPSNISESFVTSAVSTAAETWDAVLSKELFNNAFTVDYGAAYGVLDNRNSIVFGDYPTNNVIAVTSVWYSKRTKAIVEFDMLFNTKYVWGDAVVNPSVMDLQNIATHEFGHSVGLSDLYTSSCTAVTMYGYSNYGETQKRTLEQPDVTGLQKMYGA